MALNSPAAKVKEGRERGPSALEKEITSFSQGCAGKKGRNMEPNRAETGFEPEPGGFFSRTGKLFLRAPPGREEFLRRVAAL